MQIGEIIELYIEKLAYEGEGIAKFGNTTFFVEESTAGDLVKAEITSLNKNFGRAKITEIITSSEFRVKPFCQLAKVCGGCQWQHIDYEEQLRAKKIIIEECVKKIANIDVSVHQVLRSEKQREYRCKVQYPVGQTKKSRRFLAGYYKKGSHDLLNIKYCPVQPRIIDEISEFLKSKAQELKLSAYNEKKNKGLIRHFVFRYSETNGDLILTLVIKARKVYPLIQELCIAVKNRFPQISGVLVNLNGCSTNLILGEKTELLEGRDYIEETLSSKKFHISAQSFFQINPLSGEKMFLTAREIIQKLYPDGSSVSILDIYAGSGAFSVFIHDLAKRVVAVEENPYSVKDGKENLKLNNIGNIEFIQNTAEKALANIVCQKEKFADKFTKNFDLVILDPPRKGCSEKVLEALKKLCATHIIYASCNPSTLARDIKILGATYTAEFIQPIDMFCHTYHVESLTLLKIKD